MFFLILFIWVFYACNNTTKVNLVNQTDSIPPKEPTVYDLKMKKINAITNCFNGYSKSAFIAYHEYISLFGKDAHHYKPNEVSNFNEVNPIDVHKLKSLEDALDIPILEELNKLITSYKINARAFSVAIGSCERYYSRKGYKKDNFENGKGMHKPVIEIYGRFSAIDSLLRIQSNKIIETLEVEHLNKLKNDGFEVEYLSIIIENEAEKLNKLLTTTSYNKIKVEQLVVFHDKIKATYDKLKRLKITDKKQFNDENTAYFNNFEQFYKAVDELYVRKKEKNGFSKKEKKRLKESEIAASGVEGSPNKVIDKYEKILKSYNKNLALF